MQFVMTVGMEQIGSNDWNLVITIINRLFEDKEYFIAFEINGLIPDMQSMGGIRRRWQESVFYIHVARRVLS